MSKRKQSETDVNAELTQQFLFDDAESESADVVTPGTSAEPDDLFYRLEYEADATTESLVVDDAERHLIESDGRDSLQPTLVRASAGTGKTYQLTARYLKVLLQGARPESILATTFTRKAAGEILDRVLGVLAEAASSDDALNSLREQVGIETLPRSVCLKLLVLLMKNIHRLRICTLDSLFTQLARSFPFELGLPLAWRLTDEIEEAWLTERAIDGLINQINPNETRTLLSMLGKGEVRRSIAREIQGVVDDAYSAQCGCGPDVWDRLRVPKAPDSADLTRAAGYLRQADVPQKSLVKKLAAMADAMEAREFQPLQSETLIKNIAVARQSGTEVKFGRSKFPEGIDGSFDVLYAAVRAEALALLAAQNAATGSVLEIYDHQVTQLKLAQRTLGFSDVAERLAGFFKTLDADDLADRIDGAIDHVMLDEFQDTSPVQWQVLRPLAQRAAGGTPDERHAPQSFFCVGDMKQAIYGWRGGVAEIFDAVADQIPGIRETSQEKSYRSSPVIMQVVNEAFANLPRHAIAENPHDSAQKETYEADAVREFTTQFKDHSAAKTELPGYVSFETTGVAGKVDAETKSAMHFRDVALRVQQIHAESPDASIGILTRGNKGVAQMIFLLDSLGLDVSQEGGNPLTDSVAVEVVLSALMMVEHPGDGRWRFHAAASPLSSVLNFDDESNRDSAADQLREWIDDVGLAESIDRLASAMVPACDARDTLRLKQLVQLALQYAPNASPRLRDFVRMVREKRIEKPQVAPIRVMTIHKSKGLEFDIVVLPELDAPLTRSGTRCVADTPVLGDPPSGLSRYLSSKQWHFLSVHWQQVYGKQVAGQTAEALCLLYVAMTRARQALFLLIQPPSKSEFKTKTAASVLYHALQCSKDPTTGNQTLKTYGREDWASV